LSDKNHLFKKESSEKNFTDYKLVHLESKFELNHRKLISELNPK